MNKILKALAVSVFFVPSSTQYNTFEKRFDANGKVFISARAHGDLTAKTPYKVIANEYGPVTAALAAEAAYTYVGVPLAAVSSGADAWLQIGGYLTGMITASLSVAIGHALTVTGGAIADAGSDYAGLVGEFAVNVSATTTATAHTVILIPERVLTKAS